MAKFCDVYSWNTRTACQVFPDMLEPVTVGREKEGLCRTYADIECSYALLLHELSLVLNPNLRHAKSKIPGNKFSLRILPREIPLGIYLETSPGIISEIPQGTSPGVSPS